MATTFADLQSDVDNLAGVDVTPDERDRFINEANVELCTQARWTKDTLSIGTTVAGQQTYTLPDEFRKPADFVVTVGGVDYTASDALSARDVIAGKRELVADGLWWIAFESGVRKLGLYPVTSDGSDIEMLAVVTPDLLENDGDESPVPWDFRKGIVAYVRATALGYRQDDPEGKEAGFAEFERQVARLEQLANEQESGDGPIQVQVAGIHY